MLTWRGITANRGGCTGLNITKGYLTARDSIRIEYRTQVSPTIILLDVPNNPAAEFSNYAVGLPKGCRTPYIEIGC